MERQSATSVWWAVLALAVVAAAAASGYRYYRARDYRQYEAYRSAGNLTHARQSLDAYLSERPGDVGANIDRVELLWALGEVNQADQQLQDLMKTYRPDTLMGHLGGDRQMDVDALSSTESTLALEKTFMTSYLDRDIDLPGLKKVANQLESAAKKDPYLDSAYDSADTGTRLVSIQVMVLTDKAHGTFRRKAWSEAAADFQGIVDYLETNFDEDEMVRALSAESLFNEAMAQYNGHNRAAAIFTLRKLALRYPEYRPEVVARRLRALTD